MHYLCLKEPVYREGAYSLTSIREKDILKIMDWRNEQLNILRQNEKLTKEKQIKYFQEVIRPSFQEKHPIQILFSFLLDEELIGYGGLTHIDWTSLRSEVSFLLKTNRTDQDKYKQEFSIFLSLLKRIAFNDLQLNRLYTETFDIRSTHLETILKNGFVLEGRLREHVKIEEVYVDSLIHGFLRSSFHEL